MLRCRRLLVARLASGASLGLRTALAAEDPCAVKLFRWQEDCRNLRGRAAALGARPGELCRALLDPQRGGMPPEKLVAHLNTALVRRAWAPGTNAQGAPRSTPPLSHEALVEVARQWLAGGSECPGT